MHKLQGRWVSSTPQTACTYSMYTHTHKHTHHFYFTRSVPLVLCSCKVYCFLTSFEFFSLYLSTAYGHHSLVHPSLYPFRPSFPLNLTLCFFPLIHLGKKIHSPVHLENTSLSSPGYRKCVFGNLQVCV